MFGAKKKDETKNVLATSVVTEYSTNNSKVDNSMRDSLDSQNSAKEKERDSLDRIVEESSDDSLT